MTTKPEARLRLLLLLLFLALSAGCHTYKEVKETVHEVKEGVEKVEKSAEQPAEQKQSEIPHEGALLDNKVSALRVEEALRKAGPEFDQVEVKATKEAVVLTGVVKSSRDRARALEVAKSVHRKMKLTDQLRVR